MNMDHFTKPENDLLSDIIVGWLPDNKRLEFICKKINTIQKVFTDFFIILFYFKHVVHRLFIF